MNYRHWAIAHMLTGIANLYLYFYWTGHPISLFVGGLGLGAAAINIVAAVRHPVSDWDKVVKNRAPKLWYKFRDNE